MTISYVGTIAYKQDDLTESNGLEPNSYCILKNYKADDTFYLAKKIEEIAWEIFQNRCTSHRDKYIYDAWNYLPEAARNMYREESLWKILGRIWMAPNLTNKTHEEIFNQLAESYVYDEGV